MDFVFVLGLYGRLPHCFSFLIKGLKMHLFTVEIWGPENREYGPVLSRLFEFSRVTISQAITLVKEEMLSQNIFIKIFHLGSNGEKEFITNHFSLGL